MSSGVLGRVCRESGSTRLDRLIYLGDVAGIHARRATETSNREVTATVVEPEPEPAREWRDHSRVGDGRKYSRV
jgi:hypothetical protein